jgi:hypothetical protein
VEASPGILESYSSVTDFNGALEKPPKTLLAHPGALKVPARALQAHADNSEADSTVESVGTFTYYYELPW